MLRRALLLLAMLIITTGCLKKADSPNVSLTTTVLATQIGSATQDVLPFPTIPALTQAAANPPAATTIPTPFATFTVKPTVDNLKLRLNPGYLFDALRLVHQTDVLTVQGKSPGDEWIHVTTADGVDGWVFAQLLASSVDLKQVPVKEPKGVTLIKGKVVDALGTPIPGVGFSLAQGTASDSPSNNVVTDANGEFYSYLPENSSGSWVINFTAIACESPVWTDTNCKAYKNGYIGTVDPKSMTISLPQNSTLSFTWK